ncbi:helix-turn-helix domain-containing protein [Streptomyces sp. NPDC057250]|uniref:helix-turn-helix domain-containing protein n=1 Tax=Streptomyces sp. NPDC057250 TaxID=3346068 RepID=UPI0036402D5D
MTTPPEQPPAARPHPREAEILQLLTDGLPNRQIVRRLGVSERAVARLRAAAGIPPVPRTAWTYPAHPKDAEIRALLTEGHHNTEIHRRTGADTDAIARIRQAGDYGPPTISTIRPRFATAEEKWASLVREVEGGHLEWLGERAGANGTPVMRFRNKSVTPAGIAFTKRTGRPPVGQVRAECDYPGCIAPDCVDDVPGRAHVRAQLRAVRGLPALPDHCPHGHARADHGAFENDGIPYCRACKREQKRPTRPTS